MTEISGENAAYYKPKEAATLLRVTPSTVYALIAAGDLEAVRIGRALRISPQAVAAYLGRAATAPGGQDETLTLGDVATRLKVSKRTVEKLIAEGDLASVKVRSLRRIEPQALADYLAASTASAR
jgi:excisionase family DNA binding protein